MKLAVFPPNFWLVALFVVALSWLDNQATSAQQKPVNRWAILIGVDDYIEAKDLQFCGADQSALKEQLIAGGFPEKQIYLLHDKASERRFQPTKRNIEKQLGLVLGLVDPGDVVLLSFSGHGVYLGGKSFLCPNDAELDDPTTLIDTGAIYDLLKSCRASLKVILVDACRNDPRLSGQRSLKATSESSALARSFQEATPEGIVLLNSCSPGEISWEDRDYGHGVFMHFVIDGLQGQADRDGNGQVSLSELAKYANLNTKLHVARRYNDSQRPFITNESTLDALDFGLPFGRPPAKSSITNSLGMRFQLIPAGDFMMGSDESAAELSRQFKDYGEPAASQFSDEYPQHRVRISEPFYMGVYEVTLDQFLKYYNSDKSAHKTDAEKDGKGGWGYDGSKMEQRPEYVAWNTGWNKPVQQFMNHPVVNVSWNDAVSFCRWLSDKEGVEYRLPTEAEWEYACRGGTTSMYNHGDDIEGLSRVGNIADGSLKTEFTGATGIITSSDGFVFTSPVGTYSANAFGLYDMHGNVYEWCNDWYGEDYYSHSPSLDPRGPSEGSYRVFRGGGWGSFPHVARSAYRSWDSPDYRISGLGFRVLRSSVQ